MPTQRKTPEENRQKWRRGIRDGFDASGGVVCKGCFALRNENERLKQEIIRLTAALRYRDNSKKAAYGAHTPPSQIQHKANTDEERRKKKGGAKKGHPGHGRRACAADQADEVAVVYAPETCPDCGCGLTTKDYRERTVVESVPVVSRRVVYRLQRADCPKCGRRYRAQAPALAKCLYGNSLLSQAATMHYLHGIPLGRVLSILGPHVTMGGMIQGFHRLGAIAAAARDQLIADYRNASVRHADETGWRNDGRSGYAWLFCTPRTSLFEFKGTRSSVVPKEIFGEKPLKGVLVVDRYAAYNRLPVERQYCYAHLLREVNRVAEEFPEEATVTNFCDRLGHALSEAMRLQRQSTGSRDYFRRAKELKGEIERLAAEPAKHLAIRNIQAIFIERKERLYHWAKNRDVPPDNNRAERELRPTVIARKVSFGSQSEAGARTRGAIMSLLHTAAKRLDGKPVHLWLKGALDEIARSPSISMASLLPQ